MKRIDLCKMLLLSCIAFLWIFHFGFSAPTASGPSADITNTATQLSRSGDPISLSNNVSYQHIGQYPVSALNNILTTQLKQFSHFNIQFTKPHYAVNLYMVTYTTTIPEKNNQKTVVQGLIAVPVMPTKTVMPMISYQHGTIFQKNQVPSQLDNSMETKLMVSNFAGQGYVLIAADYIGQGTNPEANPWIVKDSSAQASYDLLTAAKAVLAHLGIQTDNLFLSGWSQGSFNTLALMRLLEQKKIPVKGVAVASSPNDLAVAFNRWIFSPSPLDVHYLVGTASMMVFAYESYYGITGLSQSAFKPEYYQTAKDFYHYKISWEEAAKILPEKSRDLFQPDFIHSLASGNSLFSLKLQANSSYNWQYQTPVHFYYGEIDEVMTPYMVQLPVMYQKTIGGVVPLAINAGPKADHRGTFLFGMKDQKAWFDSLEKITKKKSQSSVSE